MDFTVAAQSKPEIMEQYKKLNFLVSNAFPDYTKVIPQLNDKSITTNNDDLKKAIDRVSAVAINEESKSKAIKLVIESNRLSLSVDSTSRGSAIEEIDLDYNNEKVEIGFNSRYLIDICNEIDGEKINLKFLNSTSPAIILDSTDENIFFVFFNDFIIITITIFI